VYCKIKVQQVAT